jgi:DNA polymerase III delta subunit
MITIWVGADNQKRSDYIYSYIKEYKNTVNDVEVLHTDASMITDSFLVHNLNSQQLFASHKIIIIEGAFQKSFFDDILAPHMASMHTHETVWVLVDSGISAPIKKKLEKANLAQLIIEDVSEPVASKDLKNKTFAFVDTCIDKNKKESWVLFQDLVQEKASPFELLGALRFGYKSLVSVIMYPNKNAVELGLHPFVYGKMKKRASAYSLKEVVEKHRKCVTMFHEYRIEEQLLGALEQYVLGL